MPWADVDETPLFGHHHTTVPDSNNCIVTFFIVIDLFFVMNKTQCKGSEKARRLQGTAYNVLYNCI